MSGNLHANKYVSPKFLEAKTAQELQEKMLENNIKSNKVYHYTITVQKNKFYAWYDFDFSKSVKIIKRNKDE